MRRRFFWALVAVAVVTVLIGSITAAILIGREVDRSTRDEFRRQAQATARLLDLADRPMGQPNRPGADVVGILAIVAAVGGHDHVEAAIVGRDPVEVLGSGGPLLDQIPGGVAGITRPIEFEAEVDGVSVAAFAQPVDLRMRERMVVVIGTNLDFVPWSDLALRILLGVAVGILLAALLAGWLSRFLGRRLEGLTSASRALAAGDLTARVGPIGEDEIGEVAMAFDEMADQLEDARRREREFLQSVGHDLRTPLTTIAGYSEALEEGKVGGDEEGRVFGVIHRESTRLSRLVEDLMLLSRIEAREFGLRPEEVDLAGHLSGVLEAFRGRADAAGVELVAALQPIPPVSVDPDRIDQIVGNLLENALRYTPEGGSVTLGLARSEAGCRISVSDTGPGIAPADRPRVFERLYVTQRYRPIRPEGSGLGLAIVKELAEAMGGRAMIEDAHGGGTTITVEFPGGSPPTG